jgi:membrane protein YqaA with SNARE-associated domain
VTTEFPRPDKFSHSARAHTVAFIWGFAEATLFFIVPDVLLSAIGCRSIRAGLKASMLVIAGALIGGTVMYKAGGHFPEQSKAFLTHIPAIHSKQIDRTQSQLAAYGILALLIGPTEGIPYKIYATEWGIQHGNLIVFILISIPARGIRFLLSVFLANGICRWIQPWTKRRVKTEMTILAIVWIVFYAVYFCVMGW